VTGELDVVAALNGLVGLSGLLGRGTTEVDPSRRAQVEEFPPSCARRSARTLSERGARFEFDFALDDVHQPVEIG